MNKAIKILRFIEEAIPAAIFLIICVVMLVQVFSRSLFNYSFSWNVEFTRYMLVWLTFGGISYVRSQNSHIKLEMVSGKLEKVLPKVPKMIFIGLKEGLSMAFLIFLIVLGLKLSIKSWNFRSSAMQIRQFWLYFSVTFGAACLLFRELSILISNISSQRKKGREC